ncbi:heavy metal translocating P-type ATPase [Gilvimarinus polysaccharolyticus]|uniref:heavy metal translocating P-type ATPase n=1 Tax=Gilvimarinus polysaccharolyticus TaxID=863921 RepID=UPI0006739FDD|nr:heavy metal translocating P-type ATPase [Gilvimarinus polysaccharolyticus]
MSFASAGVANVLCYHCAEPVATGSDYTVEINGELQPMCCPGCQAVASAIVDGGLTRFYQYRTEASERPQDETPPSWQIYDLPDLQQDFVVELSNGRVQAHLLLEGISCAACSWLIETHLQQFDGVEQVQVNVTSFRTQVSYNPDLIPLSRILAELHAIGYRPRPATDDQQRALELQDNRMALMRLGVAGFGMMQAGMVAVGLYMGASDEWQTLLRVLSMVLSTPVVLFSAWPFFRAAWHSLKAKQLIMDVPVALAVGLGYSASCWATFTGTGEVYFESISMFVFFLLVGRYLEMRARYRHRIGGANIAQLLPAVASRWEDDRWQQVAAKMLRANDRIRVAAGDTFPADGQVLAGASGVNEALLTGESVPVAKRVGSWVIAGSQNNESPLEVRVSATGGETQLSAIEQLIARAQAEKPPQMALADKVARYFIGAVLVVCSAVFTVWQLVAPERALWVALSVLVVTCPCALALAMPTAVTAATEYLRRTGVLLTRGHVLETLTKVNRVIFDKTGTLTQGQLYVAEVQPLASGVTGEHLLALCAALEQGSNHPIARAFSEYDAGFEVESLRQVTGGGVSGCIEAANYRLGNTMFAAAEQPPELPPGPYLWLLLTRNDVPYGFIGLADKVRDEAAEVVAALLQKGLAVELLSGDTHDNTARLAQEVGIACYQGGASPADKLARLQHCQAQGDVILMVGDGINDVPTLSGADVSIAMAGATDLARTHADCLLLQHSLQPLLLCLSRAHATRRVIRQNLTLSLVYNSLALPLAALGLIPPWAAALGMTASSLLVVLNALRLTR